MLFGKHLGRGDMRRGDLKLVSQPRNDLAFSFLHSLISDLGHVGWIVLFRLTNFGIFQSCTFGDVPESVERLS
jgi:hypothetical protein